MFDTSEIKGPNIYNKRPKQWYQYIIDRQQMSSNINYTFAKYSLLRNEGKEQDQEPKKFQMIIVVFLPSYYLLLTVKFDKKILLLWPVVSQIAFNKSL